MEWYNNFALLIFFLFPIISVGLIHVLGNNSLIFFMSVEQFYKYSIICSSLLLLMNICLLAGFWLLWVKQLWRFCYTSFGAQTYYSLDYILRSGFVGERLCICSALATQSSKVIEPIYTWASHIWILLSVYLYQH